MPVSLFDDTEWHVVEVALEPQRGGATVVSLDLDNGEYTGSATIEDFALPTPAFLGFTGRTGGANNLHWARAISTGTRTTIQATPAAIPRPPSTRLDAAAFTLGGDAALGDGGVLQLTGVANSQQGTAFYQLDIDAFDRFHTQFDMYTGDGTGADGLCVNVGAADLGGRFGEDGVAQGVALCFDEWANDGDHGVEIMYNGSPVWQELASCGNRQGCDPVSWFE